MATLLKSHMCSECIITAILRAWTVKGMTTWDGEGRHPREGYMWKLRWGMIG